MRWLAAYYIRRHLVQFGRTYQEVSIPRVRKDLIWGTFGATAGNVLHLSDACDLAALRTKNIARITWRTVKQKKIKKKRRKQIEFGNSEVAIKDIECYRMRFSGVDVSKRGLQMLWVVGRLWWNFLSTGRYGQFPRGLTSNGITGPTCVRCAIVS
jgi:hypothetical protein